MDSNNWNGSNDNSNYPNNPVTPGSQQFVNFSAQHAANMGMPNAPVSLTPATNSWGNIGGK